MAHPVLIEERLTVEDIDALEERTQLRHELVGGVAYAMVGASIDHARIVGNLATALRNRLSGGSCEVFSESVPLHVHTAEGTDVYYPDVIVCCDPTDNAERHRERPTLIAEVESRSTRRADRREKLTAYSSVESVQEYLIIQQWRGFLEVRRRANAFLPEELDYDDTLELTLLGSSIPVRDLYARVGFGKDD
jgi:Uma2 family endonuclease